MTHLVAGCLQIVASCLDSLQPILLSDFKDEFDLRQCLRASATVPEVAGPPVVHRNRQMVDAAVFEAIPFRAAIADGCTHVVALATRPPFRCAFSVFAPSACLASLTITSRLSMWVLELPCRRAALKIRCQQWLRDFAGSRM